MLQVLCEQVYDEKVAVKGLSMSMREGEITALLGHNGAGNLPSSMHQPRSSDAPASSSNKKGALNVQGRPVWWA